MYKKTVETNKDTARKYTSIILGEQIKLGITAEKKKERLRLLELEIQNGNTTYDKLVILATLLDHYQNRVHLLPAKLEGIITHELESAIDSLSYKSPLNLIYKLEELACRNDIYIEDVLYNIQNKE